MNYKAVIHEQIEKLQEAQKSLHVNSHEAAHAACAVAKTIEYLCAAATRLPEEKDPEKEVAALKVQVSEQPWTNLKVDQSTSDERMTFSEMEARGVLKP